MRGDAGPEAGMTITEVIISMAILSILSAALMAGMSSMTKAAKSTHDKQETVNQVRLTIERIARDLRAANPIDVTANPADYPTKVGFSVFCANAGVGTCGANNLKQVVYQKTGNRLELVVNGGAPVKLLGPEPGSSFPANRQALAVLNSASQPVFRYYRDDGTEIDPATATATTFRDCSRTVEISLSVVSEPGGASRPVVQVTRVTLRNFIEVTGC